jgi:hypothetical protein
MGFYRFSSSGPDRLGREKPYFPCQLWLAAVTHSEAKSFQSKFFDDPNLCHHRKFGGVYSGGATPDPISNSEVKTAYGNASAGVTRCKSS